MIKILNITLVILHLSSSAQSDGKHVYRDTELDCEYHIKNGMFNGDYLSFHPNGIKKSQGKFCMNNRCGEWTVWDSLGNIRWKRIYSNNLSYEQSFPKICKLELPSRENNFYKYSGLKESDISWSYRVYREIGEKANSHFIKALSDSLLINILSGKIYVYSENFLNLYSAEILKNKLPSTSKLTTLKIYEDIFIDSTRQISETRIIGLNPVFVNGKDSIEAGWIFFPSIRHLLATIHFTDSDQALVQNLDDAFYFRFFISSIYRDYLPFSSYCKTSAELLRAQERAELKIIEAFHDGWGWTMKYRSKL